MLLPNIHFLIFWGGTGMACARWLCLTLPVLLAACGGAAKPQSDANSSESPASEPSEAKASMDQRVRITWAVPHHRGPRGHHAHRDAVLAKLRDPDSAKFRNVRKLGMIGEGVSDRPAVYCGEVNAKNAMGGYPGFAHFPVMPLGEDGETSTGKDPVNITDENEPASAMAYMAFCQDDEGRAQADQPVKF